MTTATQPHSRARSARRVPGGTYQETIEGRWRPLSVHQIAMGWWLYRQGHITRRQLRVYFAAHECAERRRYGRTAEGTRKPLYRIEEIASLVGGRGSPAALRALRADVRHLAALQLVVIEPHSISFASSVEQLVIEDDLASFWSFFLALPNRRRRVPVPRRTLRALAAGFGRAETGYMLAALLRSVFWDKASSLYRIDGRTKGSWVAEVFGLSRRAVSDARSHLIELAWLQPQDVPQWALNKYGVHDVVNVDWSPANATEARPVGEGGSTADLSTDSVDEAVCSSVDEAAAPEDGASGFASPRGDSESEFASPYINSSTSSNLNTRTLRARAPDLRGHRKRRGVRPGGPSIRDVLPGDLKDTAVLIELHRQAVSVGLAHDGRAGQLDFLALAHRARTRGRNAGGMLTWLLKHRKSEFITVADEEDATRRMREHLHGPDERGGRPTRSERPPPPENTADDNVVEACLQVAKGRRGVDAYEIARQAKGWTRERWDEAHLCYRTAQAQRWYVAQ